MSKLRVFVLTLLLSPLAVAAFFVATDADEYSLPKMVQAPVVTEQGTRPVVLLMTEHWEKTSLYRAILSLSPPALRARRNLDLWAFHADDLSPGWVQRLDTAREGRNWSDQRIIAVEDETIWVMGEQLHAVALADGRRLGGGAEIEARNPPLAGKFPREGRYLAFGNGLRITAADGRPWRIDPKTLLAHPGEDPAPAMAVSWPMMLTTQHQGLKRRSIVIDGAWYGMAHSRETASPPRGGLETGLAEQDFRQPTRYRLWAAKIVERPHPNFPNDTYKRVEGFAQTPHSPEFLQGGLLAMRTRAHQDQVIGIANPYRLLVLHQDRLDDAARQTLTCLGRDGSRCWEAKLDLSIATGAAVLARGKPEEWGIILPGMVYVPHETGEARDLQRDARDFIVRVAVHDGAVRHLNIAGLDMRALAEGLAK